MMLCSDANPEPDVTLNYEGADGVQGVRDGDRRRAGVQGGAVHRAVRGQTRHRCRGP